MKTLILLIVIHVLAKPIEAQTTDADRQIVAARDTVWRAWFNNDTAALRRFIPPAAATLEGTGMPKWDDRRGIVEGAKGFASSKSRLVHLAFENTEIERLGHTALVRSDYRFVIEANGRRDTTRGRATELFVKQGSTWLNPYWQLEQGVSSAEREIFLPDTLGANFSIADSSKKLGSLADYDTLVGTWTFRFQSRRPDGGFFPAFTGHWTFAKMPGGGLIEDHWRPDDPATPMGNSLYTYRNFDPARKVWQMIGASSRGSEVQPGLTWSDGKYLYALQRNRGVISRIRYLSITPDSFLWRLDRSNDGGKTWLLDAGIMEARRISK